MMFRELDSAEKHAALSTCMPGQECLNCGLTQLRTLRSSWIVTTHEVLRNCTTYHTHDFVYLRPVNTSPPDLYVIGQITEIMLARGQGEHQVKVRILERYDKVIRSEWGPRKEGPLQRRLFLTDEIRTFTVSHIEGKAFVAHPSALGGTAAADEWVTHDDHFLVDLYAPTSHPKRTQLQKLVPRQLKRCEACVTSRQEDLDKDKELLRQHGPLRCLELFAGAGGLTAGLHQSGFVETKWAVELSPSAALSFAYVFLICSLSLCMMNAISPRAEPTIRTAQSIRSARAFYSSMRSRQKADSSRSHSRAATQRTRNRCHQCRSQERWTSYVGDHLVRVFLGQTEER